MSGRGSTLVLTKVASLLDALAEHGELTPKEAAEHVAEPLSTVYRLLADLRELGYVEPGVDKGKYGLGIKLFRLGSRAVDRVDVLDMAGPHMEELHDRTGETLFLCIQRGLDGICIAKLDGIRVHSVSLEIGGSLPLHAGAAPLALLAFQGEDSWSEYIDQGGLRPWKGIEIPTPAGLHATLSETVERGYAVSDGDVNPGIAALGAPLYDYEGRVRASLSLSGVREAILADKLDEMSTLLLESTAAISASLGYDG